MYIIYMYIYIYIYIYIQISVKSTAFYPYFGRKWSIPTPLFKIMIFKLFLYVYFLWFSYSYS